MAGSSPAMALGWPTGHSLRELVLVLPKPRIESIAPRRRSPLESGERNVRGAALAGEWIVVLSSVVAVAVVEVEHLSGHRDFRRPYADWANYRGSATSA